MASVKNRQFQSPLLRRGEFDIYSALMFGSGVLAKYLVNIRPVTCPPSEETIDSFPPTNLPGKLRQGIHHLN